MYENVHTRSRALAEAPGPVKLLWVKTDFLHPTTHGGQIRSLEILKRLHRRHEVHYAAFAGPDEQEGPERASEYSTQAYAVTRKRPRRFSPAFWRQFAEAALRGRPFSAHGFRSAEMRALISRLVQAGGFDRIVCDFPYPAVNIDRLEDCIVFQHNVEWSIWRRQADHEGNPLRRWFFLSQAAFTRRLERQVCGRARGVVAVSENDARLMAQTLGIAEPSWIPTGVDCEYFRPASCERRWDLSFVGAMDWLPNVDGVRFFAREVLPIIQRRLPGATLVVAGRQPASAVEALARENPAITVTGTVPDVRPYLWGSRVLVAPLRMGGGTRLKIYEAMAAERAVVSTSIGAEGLTVHPPSDIRIADGAEAFAAECIELLEKAAEREAVARAGAELVRKRFSWDRAAEAFERAAGLCR